MAGATALAAATIMVTAGDSAADDWDHIEYGAWGILYVKEHGDRISICDNSKDGKGVLAEVKSGGKSYVLRATQGVGSCRTGSASQGGARNLPENKMVHVEVGTTEADWPWEFDFKNDD